MVPDIVPVGMLYQVDLIANPPPFPEANKWQFTELNTEDVNRAIQNHQAYAFDDDQLDEVELYEEQQKVEFRNTADNKLIEKPEKTPYINNPIKF